jgi:hypothetical protein
MMLIGRRSDFVLKRMLATHPRQNRNGVSRKTGGRTPENAGILEIPYRSFRFEHIGEGAAADLPSPIPTCS